MKFILVITTFLFVGCATHAPISEMVMFNKEREISSSTDSVSRSTFSLSGSFNNEEPNISDFNSKDSQDYVGNEEVGIGDWSLNATVLSDDFGALGISLGGANGADITIKTFRNTYTTFTYSLNSSGRLIYQYRVLNEDNWGFSSGLFVGMESKYFYRECIDDPCGRYSGPEENTQLISFGWRNRFLLREKYRRGLGISGSFSIGYLPEIERSFIGLSVTIIGF